MDFNKLANSWNSEFKMEFARDEHMRKFRRRMIAEKSGVFLTKEKLSLFLQSKNKKDLS